MRRRIVHIAGAALGRPLVVLALVAALTLIAAVGATRLEVDAGTDTLVDRDADSFAATERLKQEFGDDAIAVLVRGDLQRLVLTDNLGVLLRLEACLSGRLRPKDRVPAPVCREITESEAVRVMYGPATFLQQSAAQASDFLQDKLATATEEGQALGQAVYQQEIAAGASEEEAQATAEAAARSHVQQALAELFVAAQNYGVAAIPQLDDPQFVSAVVFDSSSTTHEPKSKFSYLFPSADSALISVRLEPGLSEEERVGAIALIREAVSDDAFKLDGGNYVISGVPVVVDELSSAISSEMRILLLVGVGLMALTLLAIFGGPLRLMPLLVALVSVALLFGALALVGGRLTMASIAVLPILIGLSVDYAVQFQARLREALEGGESPVRAAAVAARKGGPVIAVACLATAAGFAVLALSPVPMVRGFGLLLVAGVVVGFTVALLVGLTALSMASVRPGRGFTRALPEPIAAAAGGVRRRAGSGARAALAGAIAFPLRVLGAAALLAVAGWVLGARSEIVSDIRELVPAAVLERAGVDDLQEETGVSGELNVLVSGDDVADPEVIAWMAGFKDRVLEAGGYSGPDASCKTAEICPQIALSDLPFGDSPSDESIEATLAVIPGYFLQAVFARDPSEPSGGEAANVSFGIPVMPLDQQADLIEAVRAALDPPGSADDPPAGITAELAGLPVLAADANSALADSRLLLVLAGLGAVALALLVAYRSLSRALIPLFPILLATGWSALIVELLGIPLNPMSATLGALVIAIATEFSVLLAARYREERGGGLSVGEALRITYARTGAAVLVSGVTAIAGFAILCFSGIPMLRDFGIVTVVDLSVALAGVLLVLPATLVVAEEGLGGLAIRPAIPGALGRPRRNAGD